jgi:hypothetical protein
VDANRFATGKLLGKKYQKSRPDLIRRE